jgi:septum formation protein
MQPRIYLASRSPRRRELLEQIGLPYGLLDVEVDETPLQGETAQDYVVRLAMRKARVGHAAAMRVDDLPVLAADTAVVLDDMILGKPRHRNEALSMMARLSGRAHRVFSAVALVGRRAEVRLNVSEVGLRQVSPAEAEAYWASGEPADKAGGYAIQGLGAVFVKQLRGSYSGVMGLPLYETAALLRNAGIPLPWLAHPGSPA